MTQVRKARNYARQRRWLTAAVVALVIVFAGAMAAAAATGSHHSAKKGAVQNGLLAATATADSCGYAGTTSTFNSATPYSSYIFNESTTLKGATVVGAGLNATINAFYSDEHALTLGKGTISAFTNVYGTSTNPSGDFGTDKSGNPIAGRNPLSVGDTTAIDPLHRPIYPAAFVTDITNGASKAGDWQSKNSGSAGGVISAQAPNFVGGTWKVFVSGTTTADPGKGNGTNLGTNADAFTVNIPGATSNEAYGAEVRWNAKNLKDEAGNALVPGHVYRIQFIVHDGDQNNAGGDVGEACVSLTIPTVKTQASAGAFGSDGKATISDTATPAGLAANQTGSLHFTAYGPQTDKNNPVCNSTTLVGSPADIPLAQVNNTVNHQYGPASLSVTKAGDYTWTVDVKDGSGTTLISSGCTADPAHETSTPTSPTPTLPTDAGSDVRLGTNGADLSDSGKLSGGTSDATGTITWQLFKDDGSGGCGAEVTDPSNPTTSTVAGANGVSYTSPSVNVTTAGKYHWIANYGGDSKNDKTSNTCNGPGTTANTDENVTVINPSIDVTKSPASQSVALGGTAHFTIKVTNNGDSRLTDIETTDVQASDCVRDKTATAALINTKYGRTYLDPTEFFTYTCSLANVQTPFINVVGASGQPPVGGRVSDQDDNGGTPSTECAAAGSTEANRCAAVGIEGLSTKQNFVPNDTATLSGLLNPNGKLTFSLYKGACDAANRIYTEQQSVSANGDFPTTNSDKLSTLLGSSDTAGTFNWKITYTGDTNNNDDITSACGTENFVVTNG